MIDQTLVEKCKQASKRMRTNVIKMTYSAGNVGAHIGGSLSMVEIMSALYIGAMKYDINDPLWENRDRFILSKGHGAMALYAVLKEIGILTENDLLSFKKNGAELSAHPSLNQKLGIEFSSGSLGQGLSLGVGVSLALKRKNNNSSRIFVLLGDGECDEGSVWEAAACAAHYKLSNLVAIVDKNNLQYDGKTEDVLSMNDIVEKWKSFGWDPIVVDGHSEEQLLQAFKSQSEKPVAIIANTIQGKGVSFMEDKANWHNNRMTEQQFNVALGEQESVAI